MDEAEHCDATGKRIYSSAAAARGRMRRVRGDKSVRRLRDRLRAYRCDFCRGWHLSNPEKA